MSESTAKYETLTGRTDHLDAQSEVGPGSIPDLPTRLSWKPNRQICEPSRDRSRRADGSLAEKVLHAAWRRAGFRGASIRGRDGRRYRVVYPGRPAGGYGPDFRDAALERDDGVRIHGDIEVHVRSSEWKSHGHGSDSQYNGVVFHVASVDDTPNVETLSGVRIPLLVLDQKTALTRTAPQEAHSSSLPVPSLSLAQAGLERFKNRSHGLRIAIESVGRDQAIWEAALETLGYPSNRRGFIQLARRLDWSTVSELAETLSVSELSEIFTWAAGLGPRPETGISLKSSVPQWRSTHGRPANRPINRIEAAVSWACTWKSAGPAESIVRAVRSARSPSELSGLLMGDGKPAPLGVSRARDTVVNVILPGARAIAEIEGDHGAIRRATELFRSHPKTQLNSIEREAMTLLKTRGFTSTARNACEQQGLIHIYRQMTAPTPLGTQMSLL